VNVETASLPVTSLSPGEQRGPCLSSVLQLLVSSRLTLGKQVSEEFFPCC
jgi:hypothetical protein